MSEELISALAEAKTESSLDDVFAEMVPLLQQRLEQEDADWARIQQLYVDRRAQHEGERSRLLRVLKDLGFEPKKPRAKRDGGDPKPSPESIEKAVRWLASQDEAKSFIEIAEGIPCSLSSATKQINIARQLELVRIASHGGKTGRQQFFAVNDDALQRLDEGRVQWP
jgi:hypothetical protein